MGAYSHSPATARLRRKLKHLMVEHGRRYQGANRAFGELYPGTHLLPSGEIFYSRTGSAAASGTPTAYLTLTGLNSGSWTDYGQQQFYDRQEGMSVLMIDTTATPLHTSLYVFGGGV